MPELAEGIDTYIARFRAAQGAPGRSLAAARLASDMAAELFALPEVEGLKSFTTFIVREGQELGVRIHLPAGEGPRPGIVYFHGGGFAFGSIESFDGAARALALHCGAAVASVQYRRLPENRYADAQQDCDAALDWLVEQADILNVDPARVAVAGDSVGALLATVAAMRAHERGIALAAQLLLYGAYAMRPGRPAYAASRDPLLTGERVEGFIDLWHKSGGPSHNPAPLDVADLAGLPPTVMLAAELDPLLAESLAYADRLTESGVPVSHHVAPGMIHGFLRAMPVSPPAAAEMAAIAQSLSSHLEPRP
ncbi:MAG: alpha/beta hydrolase [Novosphingobium sp.]|nr:alpha/beta hydrolase [Novosphingobium sp.]